MTIKKPANAKKDKEIQRIIDAGGSSAGSVEQPGEVKKFQMVIPKELCDVIDKDRNVTGMSRRSWLLQAAKEKLERERRI